MAYVGLRKIKMAPLTKDGTYGDVESFGKAIGLQINPNYAEGSLFADDVQAEYDKEFSYADVTLNTSTIPKNAHKTIFGHETSEEGGITYKAEDETSYVGMSWISAEKIDGVRSYVANFLHKVKFSEPSEDYSTKGESIEYKTPSISGRASALDDGKWKTVKPGFVSEAEAETFINGLFGAKAQAAQAAAQNNDEE